MSLWVTIRLVTKNSGAGLDSQMKPIDFQGIASFDRVLVEHLHDYLSYSEAHLSKCIINSIHPLPGESLPPSLPPLDGERLRLRDAVQSFGKSVATVTTSQKNLVSPDDWQSTVKQVNAALWEYVEVLEGCVTELYQQLNQVGFENWHEDLTKVVEQINQSLIRQLDECEWLLKRIEPLLWDYRRACEEKGGKSSFWKKILLLGSSLLDRSIYSYLKKSKRFLSIQSKWFTERYNGYHKLKDKIENSSRKFKGYHIYSELNESVQRDFKKLYELLKLWTINVKTKSLPPREPIRAIRSLYSLEYAEKVFDQYYRKLEEALYEKSRDIKVDSVHLYRDPSSRKVASEMVRGLRAEVHTLGATIECYRDFDLRTHPNPYVRNRWGFTEWVVGPEPEKTRELLDLVYEVEFLDKLLERFGESINKGPQKNEAQQFNTQYEMIKRTLHEMGQPLSSKAVMKSRAERLLEQMEEINELGSFDDDIINMMGKVFSKAMRADWQYHVLFEFPLFHQLYRIHQGITGKNTDLKHQNRMSKFREIIDELQGWVKKCDTHRHVHEIETDMNDMRGYLQDFLALVQNFSVNDGLDAVSAQVEISHFARQLLEYRYLFGSFFQMLHQHEPEGKLIRNQFLFVDQYFEAVESQLHEMRQKWRLNISS